ncbi:DNA repair and recombination protein RAD54B-like isoform X2 [Emydura macquarii macquarii]
MRRSAAPSQRLGNSAKKARFMPPGKNNTIWLKNENEQLVPEMKLTEEEEKQQSGSGQIRALSSICGLNINSTLAVESLGEISPSEMCNEENECKAAGRKTVNRPKPDPVYVPTPEIARPGKWEDEPHCFTKYFSVVWCKSSKKKHKKWEGDAVLIAKGKSVILKDIEGKDLRREAVLDENQSAQSVGCLSPYAPLRQIMKQMGGKNTPWATVPMVLCL